MPAIILHRWQNIDDIDQEILINKKIKITGKISSLTQGL